MTIRSTEKIVTFANSFTLPELDEMLPAGDYRIVTDEELIEGLSRLAYHRVATYIFLPSISSQKMIQRMVKIEPESLEEALHMDASI